MIYFLIFMSMYLFYPMRHVQYFIFLTYFLLAVICYLCTVLLAMYFIKLIAAACSTIAQAKPPSWV